MRKHFGQSAPALLIVLSATGAFLALRSAELLQAALWALALGSAYTIRARPSSGERPNRSAAEASGHAILVADCNGLLTEINPSATAILGYRVEELLGRPLETIMQVEGLNDLWGASVRADISARASDGSQLTIDATVSRGFDGGWTITGADVSLSRKATAEQRAQIQALERQIAVQANELKSARTRVGEQTLADDLTGVFNKSHFEIRIENMLRACSRAGMPLSLILLNIEGFSAYNAEHGRAQGDRALKAVATVLRMRVTPSDVVARIGGDEFAVLMPLTDSATAQKMANTLRHLLHKVNSLEHPVRVAIGCATSGPRTLSPCSLRAEAEEALLLEKAPREASVALRC
jgi:diguanylate cyclase (GGDEF)-like protein/PAS domain S-box-containing protein